jgi:SAM-dependent methyltransferase
MEPKPERKLVGHVDCVTPARIAGWVSDTGGSGEPFFIDIFVNQEKVASVRASVFREDLQKRGHGDGRKGFVFDPAPYLSAGENKVRVTCGETGEILPNGERVIRDSAPILDLKGSTNEQLELSQARWKRDEPAASLTWGRLMTGDSFVDEVLRHHRFAGVETIFEIGPGYGRILQTLLDRGIPFQKFVGMELSAARVERLSHHFNYPHTRFLEGDILRDSLDEPVDIVLCSSTFEHLFPTCLPALKNVRKMARPDTKVFIDFLMADERLTRVSAGFEKSHQFAYVRTYSAAELEQLFDEAGFSVLAMPKIVLGLSAAGVNVRRALVVAQAIDQG